MAIKLKSSFPQKCIGCELCVLEAQRQLGKGGVDGALIRIFKKKKPSSDFLEYYIELDGRVNSLNIEDIKEICPTEVFEIIKEDEDELLS